MWDCIDKIIIHYYFVYICIYLCCVINCLTIYIIIRSNCNSISIIFIIITIIWTVREGLEWSVYHVQFLFLILVKADAVFLGCFAVDHLMRGRLVACGMHCRVILWHIQFPCKSATGSVWVYVKGPHQQRSHMITATKAVNISSLYFTLHKLKS